jgi:hypothetical protein
MAREIIGARNSTEGDSMQQTKMTEEQFLDAFSKESGLSRDKMRQARIVAAPCPCGFDFCDGFLMVQNREAGREVAQH